MIELRGSSDNIWLVQFPLSEDEKTQAETSSMTYKPLKYKCLQCIVPTPALRSYESFVRNYGHLYKGGPHDNT